MALRCTAAADKMGAAKISWPLLYIINVTFSIGKLLSVTFMSNDSPMPGTQLLLFAPLREGDGLEHIKTLVSESE